MGTSKIDDDNATKNHQRRAPPASLQSSPSGLEYDDLGRVVKQSFKTASSSRPGAFSSGGPGDDPYSRVGAFHSKSGSSNGGKSGGGSKVTDPTMCKSAMSETSRTSMTDSSIMDGAPKPVPLEVDHFDATPPPHRKPWVIPVVLMALIAVLAVIVPVAVIMTREDDSPSNHLVLDDAPTAYPYQDKPDLTLDELHMVVPNLTEATLDKILQAKVTPQALALNWALGDPYWLDYEGWRKTQRYAMAVMYYSMGGPDWRKMSFAALKWLSYHHEECDWMTGTYNHRGDICDEDGRYIHLQFKKISYLRGQLPPEMYLLSHLTEFDFESNDVGKNITHMFAKLLEAGDDDLAPFFPSLHKLKLQDCRFTGAIPAALGTLTGLTELDLHDNDLEGEIPTELALLTNLETLDLSNNELTGTIPSELGNLTATLNTFQVQDNFLDEQPLPELLCATPTILMTDWCQSYGDCCPEGLPESATP